MSTMSIANRLSALSATKEDPLAGSISHREAGEVGGNEGRDDEARDEETRDEEARDEAQAAPMTARPRIIPVVLEGTLDRRIRE